MAHNEVLDTLEKIYKELDDCITRVKAEIKEQEDANGKESVREVPNEVSD